MPTSPMSDGVAGPVLISTCAASPGVGKANSTGTYSSDGPSKWQPSVFMTGGSRPVLARPRVTTRWPPGPPLDVSRSASTTVGGWSGSGVPGATLAAAAGAGGADASGWARAFAKPQPLAATRTATTGTAQTTHRALRTDASIRPGIRVRSV